MPNFRRGPEAIRAAATASKPRRFNRTIFWGKDKADREKYIQFVTPLAEVPEVLWHGYINVGINDDGSVRKMDFISRRDRAFEDEGGGIDGYDPIWSVFDVEPKKRNIAVALVLEPVKAGGKVKSLEPKLREYTNREGETVQTPEFGFIIQSPYNFFNYFTEWEEATDGDMTKKTWKINKTGEAPKIDYAAVPLDFPVVDLSQFEDKDIPSLDDFLAEMSDEERMRTAVDPLVAKKKQGIDWKISDFADRGKNKGKKPVPVAVSTDNEEEPPFDPDPPQQSRRSAFAALQEQARTSA